jgi:hypothetical protein
MVMLFQVFNDAHIARRNKINAYTFPPPAPTPTDAV